MEKYGFVYIWRDKKHNRYYIGCHWGTIEDGYICSSSWMMQAYRIRKQDFKRRILKTNLTRQEMYIEEQRYFDMIKQEELKIRYYNLNKQNFKPWHLDINKNKTIGQKISLAKKGKKITFKNPTERGRKISEAKKASFAKRFEETGHKMPIGHKCGKASKPHSAEWKEANSKRMKAQWSDGTRSKEEMSKRMLNNRYALIEGKP